MLDGESRRTVLKMMAASLGLAGLTACRRPVEHIFPISQGIDNYVPGDRIPLHDRDIAGRTERRAGGGNSRRPSH